MSVLYAVSGLIALALLIYLLVALLKPEVFE
jgi:K+-transporting ATPase KdpF subunit